MNDLTTIDEAHGPAMAELTERQRLYVLGRVWRGFSQTDAAAWAGYSPSGNRDTLAVTGSNLAHSPLVIAAVREETDRLRYDQGAASIRCLMEIRDSPVAENKDKIRASVELLDRSGYSAETSHTLNVVKKEEIPDDILKSIMATTKRLGLRRYFRGCWKSIRPKW